MALAVALTGAVVSGPSNAQVADEIVTGTQQGQGKPVQIEADSMEVRQNDKQAEFTGNVDAKKGNVRMTSNRLLVDYVKVAGKNKVTFLNAKGNVVVVSKGQTVKAQWAKMDVDANTVIMGDNVTVLDGKSVIKCAKLQLNMGTGISNCTGRVQSTFFQ